MTSRCCAFVLLACAVISGGSCAPSTGHPKAQQLLYSDSFHLARSTRTRVQQLILKYVSQVGNWPRADFFQHFLSFVVVVVDQNEQLLGNKQFEDRSGQLKDLPLLSTDFNSWLKLTDWERLGAAFTDMQVYKKILERKRSELEREEKEKRGTQALHAALIQSMKNTELDLRDLIGQVRHQMSLIRSTKATIPPMGTLSPPKNLPKTIWERRVEGYLLLRDLNLYLTKLARDFLLLTSINQ
ncbi:uncharacterized protein LOC144212352 isoform X1 [Stigmatopora nigra]